MTLKNLSVSNCYYFCLLDLRYHFTTLGAKGTLGPTSNKRYEGTSLEGISVQGGLQTWRVPVTGKYQLELYGATGGDNSGLNTKGGLGARVKGSIHLKQGTELTVLVGQNATRGGGGGGTFVVLAADNSPLAIAGGGGAADIVDGDPGQVGELGTVNVGKRGEGGKVCVSGGQFYSLFGVGGGGGLTTDGRCYDQNKCNKPCLENDGGKAFVAGGRGGYNINAPCAGGFGGGGNCGGGGGYSGGGVQVDGRSKYTDLHAGGGGSFVPNGDWTVTSGNCPKGNGFVNIEIMALD